ncbi:MAG: hypothetical protein C4576_11470 [Desulfobacteraceae bacterium]|nr:MAG: hypothetical protein C4576_11470 [Desulfobacteraceae bacterium]
MIMPANNAKGIVHFFAGRYPGSIGWLMSPRDWKKPPEYMPYALDNGAFTGFIPAAFMAHLHRTLQLHRPLWIVVPDVVGDSEGTFRSWHRWHLRVAPFGPLAFACQDGMEPQDVPQTATCCFIGGSTEWKLKHAHRFKGVAPLLHIGRVSTGLRLHWAQMIGADSVDGTGFFRGNKHQLNAFMEGIERRQSCLQF